MHGMHEVVRGYVRHQREKDTENKCIDVQTPCHGVGGQGPGPSYV